MQPLLLGGVHGRRGHTPVRHEHGDVRPVHRPGRPVEDLQIRRAYRRTAGAVAAVLALDDPAPPERVGGFHVRAQVAAPADPLRVRRIRSRIASSNLA